MVHLLRKKIFVLYAAFCVMALMFNESASAQTDSVYWDFGTSSTPTAFATLSTNVNVPASGCKADTGKLCCNLSSGPYTPNFLTNAFGNGTFPGASGQPTIRTACKTGAFNATSSSYISFFVKPTTGFAVTIKSIEFGGQKGTSAGPGNYAIRTSTDAFAANVASGTLASGSMGSSKKSHTGLTIAGASGTAIEVRIYGYGTLVTQSSGDLFLDDIVIKYDVAAVCAPNPGIAVTNIDSFCVSGAPVLKATGASYGTGFTHQWYSSANGTASSFSPIANATDTVYTSSTLTDTAYFYCVTKCQSSSMLDTSNSVRVRITSPVSNPAIAIKSTDTSICPGTPVTFSVVLPANNNPVVTLPGTPVLTTTASNMTGTSGCVGTGGYYANTWGTTNYWQYRISTSGYENITFNAPTSSSNTGPHTGTVYYSTNGTTFTQVGNPYNWSGTTCTSTGTYTLPAAAANQPNLYIRLVMTGASAPTGTNRVGTGTFKGQVRVAGVNPAYQWKRNGNNVGTNSTTYIDNNIQHDDKITVEASAGVCASPAVVTSNTLTMIVEQAVTPSVAASLMPNDTICSGTPVTFTASPTNGGTAPTYQWKLNGANVGTNSATYNNSTLTDKDVVTCVLTSSAACVTVTKDTSDTIAITVNPVIPPSITTTVSPDDTVCAGTLVTFTATVTNEGLTPTYQWMLNGTNVGTNSNTYTTSSLNNNDVITCELTSSALCLSIPKDTSDTIRMAVNPMLTTDVSTTLVPNDTVCAGTNVTFTATPVNSGATPVYKWMLNGSTVGSNNNTYSNNTLSNNDVITCELASSETCLAKAKDTSDAIKMTIEQWLTPTVTTVISPDDTVCAGTSVTFTATPVNGGTTPAYKWMLNGATVGTNSATYSSNSLNNNDVITCEITSNALCLNIAKDTSDTVTMVVNPMLTTIVTTSLAPDDTICAGTNMTFSAAAVNGGNAPVYQWMLNGNNVGTNTATYSNNTLSNNDVITCEIISSETCLAKAKDTSDQVIMTVNPVLKPSIDIFVSPNDTVCAGTPVTFTSNVTFGGNAPVYKWKKNNNNIPGAIGNTWFSSTLAHGDIITCELLSNALCADPTKDTSNYVFINVPAASFPKVSVVVTPGTRVETGTTVTFSAIVTDGGTTPTYQWEKNGIILPGETNVTYVTSNLKDKDTVNVTVTSSDTCANPSSVLSQDIVVDITVSVNNVYERSTNLGLYPNPNNGVFSLKGELASSNGQVYIEIVNSIGAVIYRKDAVLSGNQLDTKIELGDNLNNGLHVVRIISGNEAHILKFVVNK